MPSESAEIPEVAEEQLIRPFVDTAESAQMFIRGVLGGGLTRRRISAYELVYRHLLDHTAGRSGTDIDVTLLAAQIQWCIELAVKVGQRAPRRTFELGVAL